MDETARAEWMFCEFRAVSSHCEGQPPYSARSRPATIVAQRNHRWLRPSHEIRLICTGAISSVRPVVGAQNGIFCRVAIFRRMRGEVQQPGTVVPGHDRYESILRDRRRTPGGPRKLTAYFRIEYIWVHLTVLRRSFARTRKGLASLA
jgi:hypothetical protein